MPIVWTEDAEANRLLETDPLALLIGMVLDQQVKMEKAFGGPYELKQRLGHLDARKIAAMDPDKLDKVFRERPALHRFPGNMARACRPCARRWSRTTAATRAPSGARPATVTTSRRGSRSCPGSAR